MYTAKVMVFFSGGRRGFEFIRELFAVFLRCILIHVRPSVLLPLSDYPIDAPSRKRKTPTHTQKSAATVGSDDSRSRKECGLAGAAGTPFATTAPVSSGDSGGRDGGGGGPEGGFLVHTHGSMSLGTKGGETAIGGMKVSGGGESGERKGGGSHTAGNRQVIFCM